MTLRSPDGAFERRSPETLGLDPEQLGAVDYAKVNDTLAEQVRFDLGNREMRDESEGDAYADSSNRPTAAVTPSNAN